MTGRPIVSTLDRAAAMFGLEPAQLDQVVTEAGLEPWPWPHASGAAVYPWPALARLAAERLGVTVPGGRKAAAANRSRDRGRANRGRPS